MSDTADYLAVPQIGAAATAQATVAVPGNQATIIDPGANNAVRLWGVDLSVWNANAGTAVNGVVLVGVDQLLMCWAPTPPAAGGTGVGNKFGYFGGIVLPKAAKLVLLLNGGAGANQETYAAAIYTLA